MRGEYLKDKLFAWNEFGTTSACAENTHPPTRHLEQTWNYLRVRGEYVAVSPRRLISRELPPRARRIPGHTGMEALNNGTTSACAENTSEAKDILTESWNYLRVRGEYQPAVSFQSTQMELPPRARRILYIQPLASR